MKLFEKSNYIQLNNLAKSFNSIILEKIQNYDGKQKEQLKSFLEDMHQSGCQSGMISDFIYHNDCKKFYIENIDELEGMKEEFEESLGELIPNRQKLPHYTFVVWLCFEEYCLNLYSNIFEQ